MVVTVFRSRLLPENRNEFHALADEMLELATAMPGFISYKSFLSEDDERCSVIEFETPEHLRAWQLHPRHTEAMKAGRDRFYSEYSLLVADPTRCSAFKRAEK